MFVWTIVDVIGLAASLFTVTWFLVVVAANAPSIWRHHRAWSRDRRPK